MYWLSHTRQPFTALLLDAASAHTYNFSRLFIFGYHFTACIIAAIYYKILHYYFLRLNNTGRHIIKYFF